MKVCRQRTIEYLEMMNQFSNEYQAAITLVRN
jgi:hypothetical protein